MKRSFVSGIGVCSPSVKICPIGTATRFAILVLAQLCCLSSLRAAGVDLAVGIEAPGGRVSISSNLVYSVTVTNLGDTMATGVKVTNELALETTFISATTSHGACAHEGTLIICHLGSLTPGARATVSIRTQPTVQGEMLATATVESDQVDENPEDNSRTARNFLGVTDLVLTINNPPEPVVAGQVVTYMLTVSNRGPDRCAASVSIGVDDLDENGNDLISISPNKGTTYMVPHSVGWDLLSLEPGETAILTLAIRLFLARGSERPFGIGAYASVSPYGEADPAPENSLAGDSTVVSSGPGVLQFASRLYGEAEDRGEVIVEVNRVGGNTGTVSVQFTTLDGTAIAGSDYAATNGVLTFLPDEESKLIRINILPVAETRCSRAFFVHLHSPNGGAFLRAQTNAMVTIAEDYIDIIPRGVTECITVTYSNALRTVSPDSRFPHSITPDGRYALFTTISDGIVVNDNNLGQDVFRRDLTTGITRLVTMNQAGTESANGSSGDGRMSGDGRYVVFHSVATDLTTNSVLGLYGDAFVRDMETGITRLVSLSTNRLTGGNRESYSPMISSNGLVVAFVSLATDLVPSLQCDSNSPNIYALNLASGALYLVTQTAIQSISPGGAEPQLHGLSADGRFILFTSSSDELVVGDANNHRDIFVRDLQMAETTLVTKNFAGTGSADNIPWDAFIEISPDGRFVLFSSYASNLVPEDMNGESDVFLRDLISGTTRLVSVDQTGTRSGNGYSYGGTMTPDGRFVAFVSSSTDLLSEKLAPNNQVLFLRDTVTSTTTLVTSTCTGAAPGDGFIADFVFSGDGKRLFFNSYAEDLVPGSPGGQNVYMRDLAAGITTLVSANSDFTGGGNRDSRRPAASWDGRRVLFESDALNLAPVPDWQSAGDLFVWRELPPGINAQIKMKTMAEAHGPVLFISLAVTNLGPNMAHDIVVTNTLSPGIQFVSASTTGGSCAAVGNQIVCVLGDMPRRSGATILLIATATGNGVVQHEVRVSSNEGDPLLLDNSHKSAFTMTLPGPEALSIDRINKTIFINWLNSPADFQLERAPTMDLPVEWSVVTLPTFDNGVMKTVIETNESSTKAFYRLHRP